MKNIIPIFLIIIILTYFISCDILTTEVNVFRADSIVIYNYDYDSTKCGLSLTDTLSIEVCGTENANLIITPFIHNAIVLFSPSKDTAKFNENTTGILDVGAYEYSSAAEDGYHDMEYPVKEHYYFLKFIINPDSAVYGKLYLIDYSFDSIIANIEISREGTTFER